MQKSLAPSDTGALRNSIEAHFGGVQKMRGQVGGGLPAGDPELTVAVTAGGPDTFYARFVEFGTSERTAGGRFAGATIPAIPPQPFFYPAFRALRRRIRSRISRASGKAARRVAAS